ncbi:MAG: hypothetical protein H7844_05245 [Nitrospirae bacterium YQR-1]
MIKICYYYQVAKNIDFIPLAKDSFLAIRKNSLIITPTIISSLILSMFTYKYLGPGITKLAAQQASTQDLTLLKELVEKFVTISFVNFYIQMFVHALTLVMARDVIEKGTFGYLAAIVAVVKKFYSLLFSGTLFGILFVVGAMLLIVPAILVSFFFMFTYVAIIKSDMHSFTAIKESIKLVKHNLNAAFSVYLTLLTSAVTISVVNVLFSRAMESISETNALYNFSNSVLSGILSGLPHEKYERVLNVINNTPSYLAIAITTILIGIVMAFIALMIIKAHDVIKHDDENPAVSEANL